MPGHGRRDVHVVMNWGMRPLLSLPALSVLSGLSRRIRREDGVVALETFFSMLLILMTTFLFWGVASMLHNQAVLNGAVQLAAQESLIVYDRLTYREDDPSQAAATVEDIARSVYLESTSSLMSDRAVREALNAPGERGGEGGSLSWTLECSSDYSNFRPENCGQAFELGRVERVRTTATTIDGAWILDFVNNVNPFPTRNYTLTATGAAYSSGPCSRVNEEVRRVNGC